LQAFPSGAARRNAREESPEKRRSGILCHFGASGMKDANVKICALLSPFLGEPAGRHDEVKRPFAALPDGEAAESLDFSSASPLFSSGRRRYRAFGICSRTPMNAYIESFLPLFVAINVLGILPMYLGVTETLNAAERRRLTLRAVATATIVSVLILFAGQLVFSLLGITVNDLRVGGGLILLVLSISNLIFGDYRRRDPRQGEDEEVDVADIGVVPLGIPLIIGPAAITSILVSREAYGYLPTTVSLVVNMFLVFLALLFAPLIGRVMPPAVSRAVAKVASLFLAAISVALIRAGVVGMVAALPHRP
jgi:multiple antibiotic resistance protein